jgi:hypothetical protein
MNDSNERRLRVSGAALAVALFRVFTASFAFSGDAVMYYRHVRGTFRSSLITGTLAAIATVVVIPVFWRGSWSQVSLAAMLFLVSTLVFLLCLPVLRQY